MLKLNHFLKKRIQQFLFFLINLPLPFYKKENDILEKLVNYEKNF